MIGTCIIIIAVWFDSSTDVLDIAEIVETLAKCKLKFEKIDYDSGTYEKEIVDEKACVYINLNVRLLYLKLISF